MGVCSKETLRNIAKVKHGKGAHHKPRFKNKSIWTFGRFLTAFQDIE